jgi:hypothetical protein
MTRMRKRCNLARFGNRDRLRHWAVRGIHNLAGLRNCGGRAAPWSGKDRQQARESQDWAGTSSNAMPRGGSHL